jgi:hypothetical protein
MKDPRSAAMQLDEALIKLVMDYVSSCKYCTSISDNPTETAPIGCVKFSGSMIPISINPAACLSCVEFNNKYPSIESFLDE